MKEMIIRRAAAAAERQGSAARPGAADRSVLPLARAGRSASARSRSILSGSGSDGSRGIQDISRAGGIGALREPRHRAVQRHAGQRDAHRRRRSGAAARRDRRGDRRARPSVRSALLPRRTPPTDDRGVDAILRLLRDEYGIDFSHYKASTVTRRIERRLALNRSLDLDMYVEQLRSDPRELNSLYEDLLIGVTRFFRDDAAFDDAGAADHPGDRRAHGRRRSDPRLGARLRHRPGSRIRSRCCFHERLARAAPAGQREDPRDRRPQDVARSRERRRLLARSRSPASRRSGSSASSRSSRTATRSRRRCARASSSRRTT